MSDLKRWYDENPPPSMSMCVTQADYWKAMYEYREAEAHQLGLEISGRNNAMFLARSRIRELEEALEKARDFIDTVHDGEYGYSDCTRDELVEWLDDIRARAALNNKEQAHD